MKREINNNYEETRLYANEIGKLEVLKIPEAQGTSTISNGGRTAKYSDSIIEIIDINLNNAFKSLFINS